MKLSTAIQRFTAGAEGETRLAYERKLAVLLCALGDADVHAITLDDLEQFKAQLLARREKQRGTSRVQGALSPWYVRGVLKTVCHLFRWLYDRQFIRCNPAASLRLPKEPPKIPKAIEPATFDRLLQAAAHTGESWECARNVAFLCLLRDSGGRLGGLLRAEIGDLSVAAELLVTQEKAGQLRTLLFNDATRQALGAWIEQREQIHPQDRALFIGGKGKSRGKALTRSAIYNMLRRLASVAGLEGERFNPHSFRHAFARDSIFAGADLSEVSQMMGHSTIVTTADYYARYLPMELRRVHHRTSPGRQIKLPRIEDKSCAGTQDGV